MNIAGDVKNAYCEKVTKMKKEDSCSNYQEKTSDYLEREVFSLLVPAIEKMLKEARKWNALWVQKCAFNGVDYLAEILWNCNPRHPERRQNTWINVFNIKPFKLWLQSHPRPFYPKSWLWSEDQAAVYIQKHVRGWLVRKREDVQEMRDFWKIIRLNNNGNDSMKKVTSAVNHVVDCNQRYQKGKGVNVLRIY